MALRASEDGVGDEDKLCAGIWLVRSLADDLDVASRRVNFWHPMQDLAAPLLKEDGRCHDEHGTFACHQTMRGDSNGHRGLTKAHFVAEQHPNASGQRELDCRLLVSVQTVADETRNGGDGILRSALAEGVAKCGRPGRCVGCHFFLAGWTKGDLAGWTEGSLRPLDIKNVASPRPNAHDKTCAL